MSTQATLIKVSELTAKNHDVIERMQTAEGSEYEALVTESSKLMREISSLRRSLHHN